jgi:hypothetical protein
MSAPSGHDLSDLIKWTARDSSTRCSASNTGHSSTSRSRCWETPLVAAARSAQGRRNLAAWLKHIENRARNAPDPNDPVATYDLTWLRRELNLDN